MVVRNDHGELCRSRHNKTTTVPIAMVNNTQAEKLMSTWEITVVQPMWLLIYHSNEPPWYIFGLDLLAPAPPIQGVQPSWMLTYHGGSWYILGDRHFGASPTYESLWKV